MLFLFDEGRSCLGGGERESRRRLGGDLERELRRRLGGDLESRLRLGGDREGEYLREPLLLPAGDRDRDLFVGDKEPMLNTVKLAYVRGDDIIHLFRFPIQVSGLEMVFTVYMQNLIVIG